MNENKVTDWFGLYGGGGWGGILNPEAYSHPAKVAPGLAAKLYEYALERGYLRPGDWVVDPFGGIGGFAYHAILNGLNFVGCELEQNFVDLAAGCDCGGFTAVQWQRMFGRGERFRHNERANMSVCPRCANQLSQRPPRPETPLKNGRAARRVRMQAITKERKRKPQYTEPMPLPGTKLATQATKKQLPLFALSVVESGVYEQNSGRIPTKSPHRYQGNLERWLSGVGAERTAVILQGDSRKLAETVRGWAEGAISSPPYSSETVHGRTGIDLDKLQRPGKQCQAATMAYYGGDPGQLGNLPEGEFSACLSSPPFGAGETRDRHNVQAGEVARAMTRAYTQDRQGQDEGNLARLDDGKGFMAAMKSFDCGGEMGYNFPHANTQENQALTRDGSIGRPVQSGTNLLRLGRDVQHLVRDDPEKVEGCRSLAEQFGGDQDGLPARTIGVTRLLEGQEDAQRNGGEAGCQNAGGKSLSLEGWEGEARLPPGGEEGEVRNLPSDRKIVDSSQRPGSLQQRAGQSSGALLELSQQIAQETILGGQKARGGTTQEQRSEPLAIVDGCISSPPYADAVCKGNGPGVRFDTVHHNGNTAQHNSSAAEYGRTTGNLGNMNGYDAAVGSPPFEAQTPVQDVSFYRKQAEERGGNPNSVRIQGGFAYGDSPGNVGNDQGETFWSAAKTIVEQTYEVLKPGGVAIWITKRFVRDGAIVDFSDQWEQLCASAGFEPVERIRAWQIEDKGIQLGVFGEHKDKSIKRASFFRRLYEKRYPENAIEWEDVIVMRKGVT